ncbi:MAG: sugar transferase [Candidatus Helarchaeota archaeon]
MDKLQLGLKRLLDIIVSVTFIIILLPLFGIIALLVYISSGKPVIFKQARLGKNGVPFRIYKFRTMYNNAPDIRNPDGSAYNAEDDPRVTPIGKILRKSSLDELPQLFNVLKGEMSLVGPRPDQVDQIRFYTDKEKQKLRMKPGITGLAQISGRNRIPWEKRKQLDLDYIENFSIVLDLKILLKTIVYIFRQKDVFIQAGEENNGKCSTLS